MEVKDLVKKSSQEVRGNSNLMAIYIKYFKEYFGHEPNCAGCTFANDFTRLKRVVLSGGSQEQQIARIKKQSKMDTKTFKLKKTEGKILSFKKNGRTIHFYDNNMTEHLAVEYLTNGTPEQIEERKKLFAILPYAITAPIKEKEVKLETTEPTEEVVVISGQNYTLEKAIQYLEEKGTPTRATTVKGVQKFVDKLND
jgi:hypothetical protein